MFNTSKTLLSRLASSLNLWSWLYPSPTSATAPIDSPCSSPPFNPCTFPDETSHICNPSTPIQEAVTQLPSLQELETIANHYMISESSSLSQELSTLSEGDSTASLDRPFDDYYYDESEKETYEYPKPSSTETVEFPIKWQKGELLGRGSFGKVHLGLNLENGEMIAVKQVLIPTEGSGNLSQTNEVKALKREIVVLRSLAHENIVRYLGCSLEGSTFNIFLEFVPGGSIASIIQRFGNINENLLRLYTKQILTGLAYLHSRQIIHRDIKGANILVDIKGIIKLSDFGAAKQLEGLLGHSFSNSLEGQCNPGGTGSSGSGSHSIKGTVYWMAPEVIKGGGGYGRQADIWSLGCTVIEMAAGKPPWMDEYKDPVAALYNIAARNDSPSIPSHLSYLCQDFLRQCFHRNPRMRPNAKKLLQHSWIVSPPLDHLGEDNKGFQLRLPHNKFKNEKTQVNPDNTANCAHSDDNCVKGTFSPRNDPEGTPPNFQSYHQPTQLLTPLPQLPPLQSALSQPSLQYSSYLQLQPHYYQPYQQNSFFLPSQYSYSYPRFQQLQYQQQSHHFIDFCEQEISPDVPGLFGDAHPTQKEENFNIF